MRCIPRIVKLGGSLLANPEFPARLRIWLESEPGFLNLVLCGGGERVDALRAAARHNKLEDERPHWAAIRLMDESARDVARLVPELPLVNCRALLLPEFNCLLTCHDYLKEFSQLPCSWDVTSDSLAAELAQLFGVAEICLLKSALPESSSVESWTQSGFVDRMFCHAAAGVARIRVVNLITGASMPGEMHTTFCGQPLSFRISSSTMDGVAQSALT